MNSSPVERERALIQAARVRGRGALWATYVRLSGPGWLQSAITLGGGSLAGSLYLGVLGGYQFLWLQPVMMLLGVVMLSAIGFVTLSTGERPFRSINRHVSPVLGWGWLVAAMLANLVWAMPQFSLGTAALQQNLGLFTGEPGSWMGRNGAAVAAAALGGVSALVVALQSSGGRGGKVFDLILKGMVGVVVLSFFGVVASMAAGAGGLPWGEIGRGLLPDLSLLREPADGLRPFIEASGDPAYWTRTVLAVQRDNMITAAATAVGINMTFLLPYSLLKRGWDREFAGLATFDLSTGLFIPFVLATSCVMIAAGSQFHGKYDPGLLGEADETAVTRQLRPGYAANLRSRLAVEPGGGEGDLSARIAALPRADRQLAAMLVQRDANTLAHSLEKLTGPTVAQKVFGIGVLGMAVSTIIILMLINGFTVCEALGREPSGWAHRIGCLLPGLSGALGFLMLWGDAKARFWLAVPTSVFGMVLLPIAYITFFLMLNNRGLLGDRMPTGGRRVAVNAAMLVAIAAAGTGSLYAIHSKAGTAGLLALTGFVALVGVVHVIRTARRSPSVPGTEPGQG